MQSILNHSYISLNNRQYFIPNFRKLLKNKCDKMCHILGGGMRCNNHLGRQSNLFRGVVKPASKDITRKQ